MVVIDREISLVYSQVKNVAGTIDQTPLEVRIHHFVNDPTDQSDVAYTIPPAAQFVL